MSHVVLTCTCGPDRIAGRPVHTACPVPGHGDVPNLIDPNVLVEAGREALDHLAEVQHHLLAARAAWVSRGLPGDNPLPVSLDRQVMSFMASTDQLRKWVAAAEQVATRRTKEVSRG